MLAGLPFLPEGKGPLILILGGLAVLPVSLLWSRTSVATHRWVAGIEQGAEHQGLGPCRVVSADARSCIVLVSACLTCRQGASQPGSCEREAKGLLLAASKRAPGARVVEVGCNVLRQGSCTFVIHRGRSP